MLRTVYIPTVILGMVLGTSACAQAPKTQQPDWESIIMCKADFGTVMQLAQKTNTFQDATVPELGISKIPQDNGLLVEYQTDAPFSVAGYTTNRLVFAASGLMAVLDEPNTKQLARKLNIPATLDLPSKFIGKKVLHTSKPVHTKVAKIWRETALNISNVNTHVGKTLLGCNYTMHVETVEDKD